MNPVFIFLVILAAIVLWGLLAWIFPKVGEVVGDILKGIDDCINEENEDER